MSNISNLLKESRASFNEQRGETAKYVSKWEKTGLLEGLAGEYDKHNTAILLENQAKQLISEANSTNGGSADDWNGVALPLVRRIFAEMSAKDFVSVQPMNLPSGLVFWLDFKYGTESGGMGKGESIFGAKAKSEGTDFTKGLHNGPGRSGYSQNVSAKLTHSLSSKGADLTASGFTDADLDMAMASYFVSGSDNTIYKATAFDKSTATVTFGDAGDSSVGTVNYYVATTDATKRGDFEDQSAGGSTVDLEIPQLEVALEQEALVAKTRKLKVIWTPEFAQDLNAYHSIDAEAELTSMLSEYISMEIDLEILEMLHNNAAFSGSWYANPAKGSEAGVGYQSGSIWAYQLGSHNATIGHEIQKLSNKIHRATMRGGANFIVCSPDVATILETIPSFAVDTEGSSDQFAAGVEKIGNFANRYKVYKNPYWNSNDMIIGFRGNQFLETGAVYAPYIPLIMTPMVYDPTNFTPRKGVMTRYAKKVVRKDFFAKLTVNDLM